MNYGPLEFAAYLRHTGKRAEPATVRAARAAAPGTPLMSRLTMISREPAPSHAAGLEPAKVHEAVALTTPRIHGDVQVRVNATPRPTVLVLSSHAAVRWRLACMPGAKLEAVLLSGYGDSTVSGAGTANVARIGGYYAFRRGSAEFRHLESEVLRCTGRAIAAFESQFAEHAFEIG
jgi:hypothetical protein